MRPWFWPARTVAFAAVMLCMSWLAGTTWCQSRDGQVPSEFRQSYPPPGPCPTVCVPNVNTWGHFSTKWRQWPGEQHLDQTNPRALGKEVIPTPQGREEVPPPKAALPQQLPPSLEGTTQPPEAGRIVPPEGLLIPRKPSGESSGQPSPPPSSTPLPGGALPGLPLEPAPPAPRRQAVAQPFAESVAESFVESFVESFAESVAESIVQPNAGHRDSLHTGIRGCTQTGGRLEIPRDAPVKAGPADLRHRAGTKLFSRQTGGRPEMPGMPRLSPVPLVCDTEPERNCLPAGVYRADSIGVTPLARSTDRVEPAGYTTPEPSRSAGYATVEFVPAGRRKRCHAARGVGWLLPGGIEPARLLDAG